MMSRPRTVAIIQARMGSARFPRKVLADLAGRPVIWHSITRLRRCALIDEVVVATSDQSGDDDLAAYVTSLGVRVVRGSEANVLERLLKAARESSAEIIVRVTGDAPLVDPHAVDAEVTGILTQGADFCIYEQGVPDINEGFEAFTMAALMKLEREAADDPVAREHTCTYFKQHPGFVKVLHLPVLPEHQYRGARVSVDTPPDLQFLTLLHERLNAAPAEIDIRAVVKLLQREPSLTLVNAAVSQKSASARSRTAFIRCDASPAIGLGHLVRCLALAESLRDEKSFGITFVTRPSDVATRLISEGRHRHLVLTEPGDTWQQLEEAICQHKPDVLVLDVRDGVDRSTVQALRERTGIPLVDIDDPEDKRLDCDLLFYPPVPQLARMDWTGLHGRRFDGWEWSLLRKEFHTAHEARLSAPLASRQPPTLLITMGGSDPAGITLKAAKALRHVRADFHAVFVLGAAFCHEEAFQQIMGDVSYSFELQRAVKDMAGLMLSSDAALACFSVTAYELATAGVPAVYLSLTEDHLESSQAFVEAGIGVSLGVHDQVTESAIAEAVTEILMDTSKRLSMTQTALAKTDGLGARRIASQITQLLDQRP
jgi:spore coat polysaccharide biosynthesis protein SpsF